MSVGDVGLRRQFEVGLRFAPTRVRAPLATRSIAAVLEEHPDVTVEVVEMATSGSRVHITLAVCLGTIEDIKVVAPSSRAALTLLHRLVEAFVDYDPVLVQLPRERATAYGEAGRRAGAG